MTGPKTDPVAAAVTAAASARRPVVGLDLGGTKIAAALFGADGAVLA
ncbi:ROK family protein, partial [Streptomyces sp. SID7909]|nr:ROK family protein [Streptomyces sp. SID7909]